ncbi:MAG: SusC/RagA family TonB-linked outer membrane protein [Bacteroidales bacterium]|nr:SusC/RagA family TonB-linked outer membrane protein [Bacteroidales bacterium]
MEKNNHKEIFLWKACRISAKYVKALCLALALVAFPMFGQEQKGITLNADAAPISTVIRQIEQQSGYTFFYNNDVNVQTVVTVSLKDSELKAALNKVFAGTGISWSIDDKHVILSRQQAASGTSQPVTRLEGKVVDRNGAPITGAAILVAGNATQYAISDIDGTFSFPWSRQIADATLEVSFLGYASQSIAVGGRSTMQIVLLEDTQLLETSVVTALGIKKSERSVTYNVQTMDESVFKTREANLVNSLQGKLAGVQINTTSAGPGAETKVVMRGSKSLANSNTALYTLDGIPLPTLSMTRPGDNYSIYNGSAISGDGISNFNPDDIANMSALVGPSASALYGYKAQNGILMLTTRSAEEGTHVSYSTNTTFSDPVMLPQLQSTYGAKEGMYSSWGNKMLSSQNWSVKDFFQTGYNTQHSISLSIGRENSHTYVSAGFNDAQGVIPNNDYRRYNVTANHSEDFLNNKMHLSILAMYMNVKEQNMLTGGQYYNPLVPLYLMSPSDDLDKYSVYERYDASRNFPVQYWSWGSLDLQAQNPFWTVNRNMFNTNKNRYLVGGSLKYDILDWLDISGRARMDYNNSLAEQRNYASTSGLFAGSKGRYFNNQSTTMQVYADVLLNIHKTFGDNLIQLNANIGASIEDYNYRQTYIAGDLLGVPNLFALTNMNTDKGFYKNTYRDQTQSVFATAQVGYRNMVFLDATVRGDWNTQLVNTNSLPLWYPSVGLSAILTDIFNVKSNWFTYAKIRGSYAEVGSPIMRFLTVPTHPVTNGSPAENTYGVSDDFRPERTRSFEVGADVRLWKGKLNLSATYYHSMTFNQVFTPELPASFRYSTFYVNSGRVDNQGVELSIELRQNIGPVDWTSNLIYSRNKNKIVDMLDATINGTRFQSDQLSVGGTTGVQMWLTKGSSIGDLYVRGLKTDEHGHIWVSPTASTVVPAPVDGGIESLIYAGNINPSWTGSWRNDFSWKGISLGFLITARVGGVGVSLTEATLDSFGMSQRTADARDNGGALVNGQRIPAQAYYETIGGNGTSALGAYYTYSMTNIRLGELSIGYDIPVEKWQKAIKKLNVSFVGRNLAMIYCKAPFDPEVASGAGNYSTGIDYFMMPSTRSLGFSAKITF